MAIFLGLNGQEIDAPETEVVEVMMGLAASELAEDELASWLRSRMVPTSAR
jgi:prophage maintenance system killer protein